MKRKNRIRVSLGVAVAALIFSAALLAVKVTGKQTTATALNDAVWSKLRLTDRASMKQLIEGSSLQPLEPTPQKLHGIVRGADGNPLAGATVCASCADCDIGLLASAPKCVKTDSNGKYGLKGLAAGEYLVSVTAEGHAPAVATKSKVLSIGREGDPSEFEIDSELEEGGALVTGVVMDAFGGVVAGATVRAISSSPEYPSSNASLSQTTVGDEQGAFSLMASPGPLTLMASADGYAPASAYRTAPCNGVELVMTPSSRIRGRVLTAEQSLPVGGVRVLAEGPAWSRQQATTDQAGQFEIAGLRPGVYRLRATGERWIGAYPETVALDVVDVVDDLVILVHRAVRVEGSLLHAGDQRPCTNGGVRLAAPPMDFSIPTLDARPNSEGHVVFEAVPSGTYVVSAYCYGFGNQRLEPLEVVDQDLSGIRWLFQPRLSIEGRVVDPNGNPVSRLTLFLVSETAPAMGSQTPARLNQAFVTESDGSFSIKGLSEGHYTIETKYLDTPAEVELSEANSPVNLELVVNPVGQIAVEVSTPQGEPIDGLTVHASDLAAQATPSLQSVYEATAQGGGRYQLGPLALGSYAVYVSDSVNSRVRAGGPSGSVEVVPGETTNVKVAFSRHNGVITGQVLDDAGAPLENVFVSAMAKHFDDNPLADFEREKREQEGLDRITDSEGRFVLDGLAEDGVFVLIARRAQGGQKLLDDVSPGSDVQIVLPSAGRLSGSAVNAEGQPVEQFWIAITNSETKEQRSEAFADRNGVWSIEDVSPGPIRIAAQGMTGNQGTAELVLKPKENRSDIRIVFGPAER